MTLVVKIVGCRADVFRELKQPQWRRKIKRLSNINYFAITAFCSRATFLTNLNYATGGLEERRGIKYSFFSELFIIPYSVLLDIHYSVSSLSSNSLFRMPKP